MKTLDNPRSKEILEKLSAGWRIELEDHGGFDGYGLYLAPPGRVSVANRDVEELREAGFLETFPSGAAVISDAGRLAFIRSTDEMQDGKIYIPEKSA